jgi:hypothetical protein
MADFQVLEYLVFEGRMGTLTSVRRGLVGEMLERQIVYASVKRMHCLAYYRFEIGG